jgi:predicted DCC family thiol-disulfide oxidoreductase YuxK
MAVPFSYRDDPGVPSFPDDRPIIIFDDHCIMCSGFARFVLRHDREARFRLLPAQTALGQALYRHYGLDPFDYETNVLIEGGEVSFKSEASLRIAERLGWPWRLVSVGRLLPRGVRDTVYDLIARNRLKWFGRSEVCLLVEPGMEDRFLS